MTALTRGPLPARVYWTRRVLVLGLLVGLVVGAVRLTGLVAGDDAAPEQATPVAAEPSEAASEGAGELPVVEKPTATAAAEPRKKRRGTRKDRTPALPEPDGPCLDSDVAVTPSVDEAVGGRPITFVLEVRSVEAEACTWQVSPQSVTLKITSGKDDIWSSLQCPRAIPRREVVVRRDTSAEVPVTWSARRSEEGCNTGQGDWAMPGWYFVDAAALGGEPSDLHFEITQPQPEVKTRTVSPEPEGDQQGKKKRKQQAADDRQAQDD